MRMLSMGACQEGAVRRPMCMKRISPAIGRVKSQWTTVLFPKLQKGEARGEGQGQGGRKEGEGEKEGLGSEGGRNHIAVA